MKVTGMRELRANSSALLTGGEPVLVTRHGRLSGVYIPLNKPDDLPDELGRELAAVVGRHIAKMLKRKGVTGTEIAKDFDAYRRSRR